MADFLIGLILLCQRAISLATLQTLSQRSHSRNRWSTFRQS